MQTTATDIYNFFQPHLEAVFLSPFEPTNRIWIPFLFTGYAIALIYYFVTVKDEKSLLRRIRRSIVDCFPRSIYLHPSAILDYKYFIINGILFSAFIAPFTVSLGSATIFTQKALNLFLGTQFEGTVSATPALYIVITLLVAVADDLGRFINHLLHHKIPFLWNIHKVHHSATVLTPITLYRVHPIELFLHGSIGGLFSGFVFGTAQYITAGQITLLEILNMNVIVFIAALIGSNLRHSHVFIRYPSLLSKIVMSPAQHQVHHSKRKIHHDKNLGSALSLWDWIYGTLYIPEKAEQIEFGVTDSDKFSTMKSLYFQSIIQNLRLGKRKHS